jgi:TolA-binding protein
MLKKGYCFDALKKSKDAKAAYGELINKYPASEAAKLAEERLKKK